MRSSSALFTLWIMVNRMKLTIRRMLYLLFILEISKWHNPQKVQICKMYFERMFELWHGIIHRYQNVSSRDLNGKPTLASGSQCRYFKPGMSNSNPCVGRTLKFKDRKTVSGPYNRIAFWPEALLDQNSYLN